jgi:UDP-N-acetylmuramate--alanine ligase
LRAASSVRAHGRDLGEFHLRVPGAHNVLNATAAIAVGWNSTSSSKRFAKPSRRYTGVDRRFQTRGEARGVTVIDDYGHHPTEIRATLAAARLCKFRPHSWRFSSRIATRARNT